MALISVSGQLADVFAGWVGDGDLDFVVVVQPPGGVLGEPFRRRGSQRGGGALSAAIAVHRVLLIGSASSVNAQRQALLFESGPNALGS